VRKIASARRQRAPARTSRSQRCRMRVRSSELPQRAKS
jgi:hypothetical protein